MGAKIRSIHAEEVFAQRGNLGLEVTVSADNGSVGVATPEAGVSMGQYEAHFLLDGGERYAGMGVRKAAASINQTIAPALLGLELSRQREIDEAMIRLDGTPDKSRLGANAMIGVSLAVLDCAAKSASLPLYRYIGGANACLLPIPIVLIGHGGRYRHPGKTRWLKPSYEFVAYGAHSYSQAMEISWQLTRDLYTLLEQRHGYQIRSYAGIALAGVLRDDRELLDAMTETIARSGFEGKVGIYYDAAAGCYYEAEIDRYVGLYSEGEKSRDDLVRLYREFVSNYPLISLEDPLHEEDLEGHAILTEELGIEIVGDDLFTTNIERLRRGIEAGAANSMVLKVTQVGTVSEALDAAEFALRHGYNVHPCGSRGDQATIGDFAVALSAGQVRAFKHNAVLAIERDLGQTARWPGKAIFKRGRQ